MTTVIKSIGTSGRDYSTITAWEADLDNVGIYSAGDDAVGECYDDSIFSENLSINGGGTVGLNSIRLSVAEGERHDGTAGTGARNIKQTSNTLITISTTVAPAIVEWLEFSKGTAAQYAALITLQTSGSIARYCICHTTHNTGGVATTAINVSGASYVHTVHNCIIYNVGNLSISGSLAIGINKSSYSDRYYNNTIYRVRSVNNNATGIDFSDHATHIVKNNISIGHEAGGTANGYSLASPVNADADYNLSSDATAPGGNSIRSVVTTDQVVSIVEGSEDLHLKAGADAIDMGVDLGTSPSGIEIDINGRDRDAEGDIWDMGSHEYTTPPIPPASAGKGGTRLVAHFCK